MYLYTHVCMYIYIYIYVDTLLAVRSMMEAGEHAQQFLSITPAGVKGRSCRIASAKEASNIAAAVEGVDQGPAQGQSCIRRCHIVLEQLGHHHAKRSRKL